MRLVTCPALGLLLFVSPGANGGEERTTVGFRMDKRRTDTRDAWWVDRRVEAWQPTAAERAIDRIGWAKDLREAERLSKLHWRPVFLFTYDGESLLCHRC